MQTTSLCALQSDLFVASSAFVHAQKTTELKTGGGGSPHVRTDWTIDGATLVDSSTAARS